ncbi:MAG: lysophospholipid acyltransferase family protein [Acidimicrobiia bacterium]|nr:lysophospholipid acyltransferase family protein [Acidimicrobiia bacterium]
MADPNPNPLPEDLFDPDDLDAAMRTLLEGSLDEVVAASGDREGLHRAERRWAQAAVAALDIDIELSGLGNVDPTRQYLVAPLHEGFADVLALLQLPLPLGWVIRDELLALPYFGEYLRRAGHIAIEPEAPLAAMRILLRQLPELLATGDSVVMFPQGSLLGVEVRFQAGAFQLADRCGLPVLPVVLTGSHRVWDYPFGRTLRRGQKIHVEVLEPLSPGSALDRMRATEDEMKRRARAVPDAPVRRYVPERDGTWEGYRFELDPPGTS